MCDLNIYFVIAREVGAVRVVYIGCGTGSRAVRVAGDGRSIVGVDRALASLDVARTKPYADQTTWIDGDATTLAGLRDDADLAVMTGNVAQAPSSSTRTGPRRSPRSTAPSFRNRAEIVRERPLAATRSKRIGDTSKVNALGGAMSESNRSMMPQPAEVARALCDAFKDELDREPTLGEYLDVLHAGAREYYSSQVSFNASLTGGRRYRPTTESRAGELNDAAFVDAVDLLQSVDPEGAQRGDPLADLGAPILAALRGGHVDLADVPLDDVSKISVVAKVAKKRATIGDVIAVQSRLGGYYLGVALERNRWGLAISFFASRVPVPRIPVWGVAGTVIHTDEESIRDGSWKIIANMPDLVAQFPTPATIYHDGVVKAPGIDYGEFGLAEDSAGGLRKVDREEASRVGLLDGTYRQSRMSETIAPYLDGTTG